MTTGTVILTGANGSLGIPAVDRLLSEYPGNTYILTVRDDSERDANTTKLRETIARHRNTTNVSIRKLDLGSLDAVRNFANVLRSEIAEKKIPLLIAVIWNAMTWSLLGGTNFTVDGYERSMAVNHIAHFALTMRLLDSFDTQRGRIVFLSSDSHEKSGLQEIPSILPDDLNELVRPLPDKEDEVVGRGFQRYGLSKLAMVMVMYELRRRLKQSQAFKGLSVLAVDPGGLLDSRALQGSDVPKKWVNQIYVVNLLQPVLIWLNPILRRSGHAAKDVVSIAMSESYAGKDGYFIMSKPADSSVASHDERKQRELWDKSLEWARIGQDDTTLQL